MKVLDFKWTKGGEHHRKGQKYCLCQSINSRTE